MREIFKDYCYQRGDGHDEQRAAAIKAAVEFCRAMCSDTTEPYWLVLCGPSGCGKTMLMKMIFRFFNRFLDMMWDEQRNTRPSEAYLRKACFKIWPVNMKQVIEEHEYRWVSDASECWLTCIDDIGAQYEKHRELSASLLFQILTQREHKFTVVTSNLSVQQVSERLDTRIGSRLLRHGSVVLDLELPDWNASR